jgi:hypothetical protein
MGSELSEQSVRLSCRTDSSKAHLPEAYWTCGIPFLKKEPSHDRPHSDRAKRVAIRP